MAILSQKRKGTSGAGTAVLAAALAGILAGCFLLEEPEPEAEAEQWDAGAGMVYVRIPLPSEQARGAADFQYAFVKETIDYWEVVFQNVANTAEYYAAAALRGESYLTVAVTPGTYNVMVLGGVRANGQRNGEKVLLASGYEPDQIIRHGQRNIIPVQMYLHTSRVRLYSGTETNKSLLFESQDAGTEKQVSAYSWTVPGSARFMYNAEIANLDALIAATPAGTAAALALQFQNREVCAYLGGIVNVGGTLFTSPMLSVTSDAAVPDGVQCYGGILQADIPSAGAYMMWFNMTYYAFGDGASGSSRWNLRPGITDRTNFPLGSAVRVTFGPFTGFMAEGGDEIKFVDNGDGTKDEVHIFTTAVTAELRFKPGVPLPLPVPAQLLVIAGGGSGGGVGNHEHNWAGGGGAGGVIYYGPSAGQTLNGFSTKVAGPSYPLNNPAYTVSVGAGGASVGTTTNRGNNGGNSIFGALTAWGGGGGGGRSDNPGAAGGSGGSPYGAGVAGGTIDNQGFPGSADNDGGTSSGGGGAGGLGTNGTNGTNGIGGNGGNGGPGITLTITGSAQDYAGGGASGHSEGRLTYPGSASHGGGASGQDGVDGTGGGGSGGSGHRDSAPISPTNNPSRKGGSGIVVVRFRYIF